MRSLYLDISVRQTLTPEMASQRCLFAPGGPLSSDIQRNGGWLPLRRRYVAVVGAGEGPAGEW